MFVRFAAVCLTAATLVTPALGGTLADPTFTATLATPSATQLHSPGTISVANGTATTTAGGHGEVTGFVTHSLRFILAGASIGYDFEFFGPDGLINVDADVALYSSSNQLNVNTSAYYMLQSAASETIDVLGNPYDYANIDITTTLHYVLSANTPYHVATAASLYANRILEIDASGNAHVDSRIYISPQFAGDASAYTLELSPGISFDSAGSGSEAPEPAPVGMLLSGLAAIGFVRRRRR